MQNKILNTTLSLLLVSLLGIMWSCKATKERVSQPKEVEEINTEVNDDVVVDNNENTEVKNVIQSNKREDSIIQTKIQPISTETDDNNFIIRISFIDTLTNEFVRSFDVSSNNPYNNLNYSSIAVQNGLFKEYNIDESLSSCIDDFSIYNKKDLINSEKVSYAKTSSKVDFSGDFVFVCYNIDFISSNAILLGEKSETIILNNKGELVRKIVESNIGTFNQTLTPDGKYFAFIYGGIADESFDPLINLSFKIYDLSSGIPVFDQRIDAGYDEAFTSSANNNLIITAKNFKIYQYLVYSPREKLWYKKNISKEERFKLKAINEYGFVFGENSNRDINTYTYTFKTEFQIIKF